MANNVQHFYLEIAQFVVTLNEKLTTPTNHGVVHVECAPLTHKLLAYRLFPSHQYLNLMVSRNSLLFRLRLMSLIGMTVSQLDEPFSLASSALPLSLFYLNPLLALAHGPYLSVSVLALCFDVLTASQ